MMPGSGTRSLPMILSIISGQEAPIRPNSTDGHSESGQVRRTVVVWQDSGSGP
jgi:hypothetical protein